MGIWNFKAFVNYDREALLCKSLVYTSKYVIGGNYWHGGLPVFKPTRFMTLQTIFIKLVRQFHSLILSDFFIFFINFEKRYSVVILHIMSRLFYDLY